MHPQPPFCSPSVHKKRTRSSRLSATLAKGRQSLSSLYGREVLGAREGHARKGFVGWGCKGPPVECSSKTSPSLASVKRALWLGTILEIDPWHDGMPAWVAGSPLS